MIEVNFLISYVGEFSLEFDQRLPVIM